MNGMLKPGVRLQTDTKQDCQVVRLLGSGGQGEVYEVVWGGKPNALKWYYPQSATTEQRKSLEVLVGKGKPSERFLWPEAIARSPGQTDFGYLMPLRNPRYRGIVDLMKQRVDPTFRALATAGVHLAESYLTLHAKGLCYCDISFGNVFFDPDTGDVAICDNDNVIVNGEEPAILGTPRFMAPEVVRGEAFPSIETDKFSLAVLLFYMLFVDHPLEGEQWSAIHVKDSPAMKKVYGTHPIYIFDPNDSTNRPVVGQHDNALAYQRAYPAFLNKAFEKSFTAGIRDPKNGRVTENEWRTTMVTLRDSILYCPRCGMENFYDADALQSPGSTARPCWQCRTPVPLPFRLRLNTKLVMLNHDSKLFPHHVDEGFLDFSKPIGEVTRHPQRPDIWGLKNVSSNRWVVTEPSGSMSDVDPGRSVTLASGIKINFGRAEGEIRY